MRRLRGEEIGLRPPRGVSELRGPRRDLRAAAGAAESCVPPLERRDECLALECLGRGRDGIRWGSGLWGFGGTRFWGFRGMWGGRCIGGWLHRCRGIVCGGLWCKESTGKRWGRFLILMIWILGGGITRGGGRFRWRIPLPGPLWLSPKSRRGRGWGLFAILIWICKADSAKGEAGKGESMFSALCGRRRTRRCCGSCGDSWGTGVRGGMPGFCIGWFRRRAWGAGRFGGRMCFWIMRITGSMGRFGGIRSGGKCGRLGRTFLQTDMWRLRIRGGSGIRWFIRRTGMILRRGFMRRGSVGFRGGRLITLGKGTVRKGI